MGLSLGLVCGRGFGVRQRRRLSNREELWISPSAFVYWERLVYRAESKSKSKSSRSLLRGEARTAKCRRRGKERFEDAQTTDEGEGRGRGSLMGARAAGDGVPNA